MLSGLQVRCNMWGGIKLPPDHYARPALTSTLPNSHLYHTVKYLRRTRPSSSQEQTVVVRFDRRRRRSRRMFAISMGRFRVPANHWVCIGFLFGGFFCLWRLCGVGNYETKSTNAVLPTTWRATTRQPSSAGLQERLHSWPLSCWP